jgi:hypothetical protein
MRSRFSGAFLDRACEVASTERHVIEIPVCLLRHWSACDNLQGRTIVSVEPNSVESLPFAMI